MPVISAFYGLVIRMYYMDNRQHHLPHIHVYYQDQESTIAIPDGEVLEGKLPGGKMKLISAWIELHQAELMEDWALAIAGKKPRKIPPLR